MTDSPILEHLKNEAHGTSSEAGLERTIGARQLTLLGIGAIVGAGIFVATGIVAAEHTGPAIVFSFLIAAFGCLCTALCYAEFAAMVPVSGSAYSYTYATFGKLMAWIIGWCLILEYLMAAATVAVGWSGYLSGLLSTIDLHIPAIIASSPVSVAENGNLHLTGSLLNAPALAILLALTYIMTRGARLSVSLNAILVTLKLAVIFLFIICGALYVDTRNWVPFIPENTGTFGDYGWSGVLRGAGIIFYAYLGFDAVSTAARETRNPQRNMPIGIIASLGICTILYILFALVLTGIAPYRILGTASPISTALGHVGPQLRFLKVFTEIGALIGLTSVILVLLYGQSRILFAMARDRLMPEPLARLHPRFRTPVIGLLSSGILAAIASGFLPITVLGELISIGTLCAFVFVCAGVLILRYKRPDLERPFRTPWVHATCISGILVCGYMMLNLPGSTWLRFVIWMAAGIVIYYAYGRRRTITSCP